MISYLSSDPLLDAIGVCFDKVGKIDEKSREKLAVIYNWADNGRTWAIKMRCLVLREEEPTQIQVRLGIVENPHFWGCLLEFRVDISFLLLSRSAAGCFYPARLGEEFNLTIFIEGERLRLLRVCFGLLQLIGFPFSFGTCVSHPKWHHVGYPPGHQKSGTRCTCCTSR